MEFDHVRLLCFWEIRLAQLGENFNSGGQHFQDSALLDKS